MYEYDEECLQAFLEQQGKLFDEPVADTLEEAEAFLEDCMAAVVNNIEEVKEFLEEEGMDVSMACQWKKYPGKPQKYLHCRADSI